MTEPDLVKALEALGFSLNEGRAYAALLSRGPSTGYEVAQHASVPRSAVYSVLRKLVSQGAARRVAGSPERFSPTPPEVVLAQLKKRFEGSSSALLESVARLEIASSVPDVFGVEGYERILEETNSLIHAAERQVVVSGWPRELERLSAELAAASQRGVFVVVFSHAALPKNIAGLRFSYGYAEADLEAFWRHRLVAVVDDCRCLLGATEQLPADRAVVSATGAIAEIAVSQIALDLTLLSQRHRVEIGPIMARMLGDRVGRLDTLTAEPRSVELGTRSDAAPALAAKTSDAKAPAAKASDARAPATKAPASKTKAR